MMMPLFIFSVLPFWEEATDVTRFYLSGWGNGAYWGRQIVYSSRDEFHGGSWNRWNAMGLTWGALGGFRRNEWGAEILYEQIPLKNWETKDDVVYDPSTRTAFYIMIKRFMNPQTHTYLGFDIRYERFNSTKVALLHDYLNVDNSVGGNSFGLEGKLFLENDRFNRPNRGILPWIGGYIGFYSCSYEDDNKIASDALIPEVELNLGLKLKPWSWLDFWGMTDINLNEAQFDIDEDLGLGYDYVRYTNTIATVRVGMTLTYTRGYSLE